MSILEALQWANNKLKKTGIESPMLDAEVILSHILNLSRARLFAHGNDFLKPHQQERLLSLIERRCSFEPVAYITGEKTFYGRSFFVNPFVLIPRPATETLIHEALNLAEQINDTEHTLFADIGTGSGAIAVTLALETQIPVVATDIQPHALSVAKTNASKHKVEDFIDFKEGDLLMPIVHLFESMRASSKQQISSVYPFKHLILCANLPYLTHNQMETIQNDVRFEPKEALEAGPDGLESYWRLFKQLNKMRSLLPRYIFSLIEIDPSQSSRAVELITHQFPRAKTQIKKDLQGLDRIIISEI
ncbi:peptide chain release factor N(5)-glutamine methyltransferase [Candidatus Uhrbacteria bacterium]|nr:peptide chain release factor N(5)-glutamine methyltransferase [Candidatus Uhrbacteria bacterium]